MRNAFLPTLLAAAILLAGCSTKPPPELGLVPSQSQYDDKILDSLGNQKYAESQYLYNRQLNQFEDRVKELEEKRKALEASLSVNAYEQRGTNPLASESSRIEQYQSETQAAQARIAQENSQVEKRKALIENGRDMALLDVERRSAERLEAIERQFNESQAAAKSAADRQTAIANRERDRKLVELENEQDRKIAEAKARAAQRIADVESGTTREIGAAETAAQQAISTKKQLDAIEVGTAATRASSVRSEESRLLDEQRITVVLANADAERRTAADINEQQKLIDQMRAEGQAQVDPLKQQVEELHRQISSLEGQIVATQAREEMRIAPQLAKLDQLNNEAGRLAQVTSKLKSAPLAAPAPIIQPGPSVEAIQFVANKESELSRVRAEALAKRSQLVAQISSQLEIELANIRSSIRTQTNQINSQASLVSIAPVANLPIAVAQPKTETELKSSIAAEKAQIIMKARTDLANVTTQSEITKATVVAPVITGKGVYAGTYGEKPTPYVQAKPELKSLDINNGTQRLIAVQAPKAVVNPVRSQPPLQVVSTFKPKIGNGEIVARAGAGAGAGEVSSVVISSASASAGGVQPLVVAATGRTVYNVVYVYKDKTSFETFQNYLRAYGVNDFKAVELKPKGEYVIAAGRYYDAESAASRVLYLNKTTSTNHAKVIEQELPQ
jgi:uncharacterized protein YecA (UPF0149 family)